MVSSATKNTTRQKYDDADAPDVVLARIQCAQSVSFFRREIYSR